MFRDADVARPHQISWSVFRNVGVVVLSVAAIVAWCSRWPYFEISSASIRTPATHTIYAGDERPFALAIDISGHIDGYAEVVTPHDTIRLVPGPVSVSSGGDYYDSSASIEYKPRSVKSGHLRVKYRFN